MPPFVFFAGIAEEHMARQLFAKAEGSRTLGLVFCAVELRLDDGMPWAPWICKVDKFHIHRLEAVLLACKEAKSFRVIKKMIVSGI